jgi:hypothetical protein
LSLSREEQIVRMYENRVLRNIFGSKREEIIESLIIMHD